MYSETLALGELRYVEKLRSYWTENSISCRARYFEVIPREVFEAYEFVQSDGVL